MKKYIIGSLFAIAAVACTSVSTTTTLKGKFSGADVPEEITVTVPGMIDTTVQLRNAAFKLEIPVNKAVLGEINVGGPKEDSFLTELCLQSISTTVSWK